MSGSGMSKVAMQFVRVECGNHREAHRTVSSLPAAVYRIAAAFVVGMKIEVGQRVHESSTGLLHKPYASPAPADDEIRPRLDSCYWVAARRQQAPPCQTKLTLLGTIPAFWSRPSTESGRPQVPRDAKVAINARL